MVFCLALCLWMASRWRQAISSSASPGPLGARARLEAALIANEVGTWEWDITTDRVYADHNLAAMFGVSATDASGGPIAAYLKAIHPDDVADMRMAIDTTVQHGTPLNVEYRLRGADGDRWVLARGHLVRDKLGRAISLPGVVLDISEQRRVEGQLRQSQLRHRLALESAELGAWSINLATMQLSTDARFREIFGAEGDALSYEDAVGLIHPEDQERIREAVANSARAVDPVPYDVEHRVVRADRSIRWVHAKGRANNAGGEGSSGSHSFDGTLADITPRKHAEEERHQLLQSERAARTAAERAGRIKDEFLATLSHEIRTPLSAIQGWVQIMKRTLSPQDLAKGLEVIERNARAQTQIVEDLLDMSAIISGKVRLDVADMDLPAIVSLAVENARPAADAKGIHMQLTLDPLVIADTRGDATRMQQVLWNLVSNALKFTPPGGHIEVSLLRVGAQLEIAVTDNGQGIPESFLPFVFDRFRQADASTTRSHGGLGLGLSIVRQIAELHGGTVWAESDGPGRGSTFVVSLPVGGIPSKGEASATTLSKTPAAETTAAEAEPVADISGVRVLVVDDDQDAREMVTRLLEERGAQVTAVASVALALQVLRKGPQDVIVSDIGMPEQDAYSLMGQVRLLPTEQGGTLPGIALTAFARKQDRQRALAAGFAEHVAKPVDASELILAIATLAKR